MISNNEKEISKLAKQLRQQEREIVDKVRKDLLSLEKDIRDIQIRVKNIPLYNQNEYKDMMKLLSQFRRDKDTLLGRYHNILTDVNYRNKMMSASTVKLEAEVKMILEEEKNLTEFQENFAVVMNAMRRANRVVQEDLGESEADGEEE